MDFYDKLKEKNLLDLLRVDEYVSPVYEGWDRTYSFLKDIIQNNRKTYLEGDYDVDGLMSTLIIKDGFRGLGYNNFKIYNYRQRTHSMDSVAVQRAIQGKYDYFIIVDAGSNDMHLIQTLVHNGVKVIILDHHNTDFSYEDYGESVAMINTTIENRYGHDYRLSAGALCYTVMEKLYAELGVPEKVELAAYAATSLLADIMDMSSSLNRQIYNKGVGLLEEQIPKSLLYFKNQYSNFNARYITYWFAPRINACFRAEQFIFLNELFLNNSDSIIKSKSIEMIEQIYTKSREMVQSVSDVLNAFVIQFENFVFADLESINKYYNIEANKLYNYTGYIANNLASKNGKTAIVVCWHDNAYKGSLRDQLGKNYLSIFRNVCFAQGHDAAFGMKIHALDLNEFRNNLKKIDESFGIQGVDNAPIIVESGNYPDESLIMDMANYNEFNGPGVPVALLRKKIIGNVRESKTPYGWKYKWEELNIDSPRKLPFGKDVLLRPFYSGVLKLQVQ